MTRDLITGDSVRFLACFKVAIEITRVIGNGLLTYKYITHRIRHVRSAK